jgi:hypothetical protein
VLELSLMENAAIDLSGLSGLQQLQLTAFRLLGGRLQLQDGWVLPKQLQQLDIAGCCIASPAALGIPDMQQLTLSVQFAEADEQQALLQLAQLPCLHQLSLEYAAAAEVATTADVWRQLPALASLDLRCACQMTSAMFTSVLQVSSHSTGALWGIRLRCCKTWYKTGCCKGLHVGDTRSTISCSCMLGPAIQCTTCLKRYPSSSSESGAFTDP